MARGWDRSAVRWLKKAAQAIRHYVFLAFNVVDRELERVYEGYPPGNSS